MKLTSRVLVMLALAAAPAVAQQGAQPRRPLVVTQENRTAAELAKAGTPRRDAAVRPGDVLRYRLAFTNTAGRPVRQVAFNNPLAGGMRIVPGSVKASRSDARVEYSIDGGRTFSAQPQETVMVDGRQVKRAAPAEKYTHVRWTVDGFVAAGATVTAEFDARLGGASRGTGAAASPAAGTSGR